MGALLLLIKQALVTIVAWIGVNLVNSGVKFAISVAVVTAWGVFLGVLVTGMGGLGIFSILTTNPLSGLPHDMYCIFCSVFPFSFFVRLVVAYVIWNLTFQQAAVVMSRVVRFLFGG
jgi:hypothetical protein